MTAAPRVGVVWRADARRVATAAPCAESYVVCAGGRVAWLDGDAERAEPAEGRGVLVAVADGEGHDRDAARSAATATCRVLAKLWAAGMPEAGAGAMAEFLQAAHTRMYWKAAERPGGMAASTAVAWVDGLRLVWAEVGTARVWLWRGGKLHRLGHDRPQLTAQRVLQGSVGLGDDTAIHLRPGVNVGQLTLHEGDQILVATDGLWRAVDEPSAAQVLTHTDDPQAAAVVCMERAVARGTSDHVAVAVVDLRVPARPVVASEPVVSEPVGVSEPVVPPALRREPPPVRSR